MASGDWYARREIGPLPVNTQAKYAAQYMEAIFTPGMTAPTHRHSGPEAWYTLSGETCLETPTGKMVGSSERDPRHRARCASMHFTHRQRDAACKLVLILHDST